MVWQLPFFRACFTNALASLASQTRLQKMIRLQKKKLFPFSFAASNLKLAPTFLLPGAFCRPLRCFGGFGCCRQILGDEELPCFTVQLCQLGIQVFPEIIPDRISPRLWFFFPHPNLTLIGAVTAGDWLQGPYVYKLYQQYNFTQVEIGQLFICGFGASAVFGTFAGSLADKLSDFHRVYS